MNSDLSDIADGLSSCLTTDGESTMTAQLKAYVGTVATPGIGWSNDPDTGPYRSGANEWSVAAGGVQVLAVTSAGVDASSGQILQGGAALVPTGTMVDYIGATAPTGWVLAQGGSIGNASSSATALASAATVNLFTLIWNEVNVASGEGQLQTSAGVNTARGASAAADYAANRRILLADTKNRVTRGVDPGVTTPGAQSGADTLTIAQANLPAANLTPNTASQSLAHATGGATPLVPNNGSGGSTFQTPSGTGSVYQTSTFGAIDNHTVTFPTVALGGSGTAATITPKNIIKTKIIKL